jgi:hypothetical protein
MTDGWAPVDKPLLSIKVDKTDLMLQTKGCSQIRTPIVDSNGRVRRRK